MNNLWCTNYSSVRTNTRFTVHPDEMQRNAAFHLGLYYLQKYSFRGLPNTKG